MEDNAKRSVTLSIPLWILGILVFIPLLVVKLVKPAAISWFWVFFPLWLPWAICGAIVVVCLLIAGICALICVIADRR